MARSTVKGTNGKPRKKTKNRDQLKASVRFDQNKNGTTTVTKKDDGDPTITSSNRDRNKTRTRTKITKGTKTVTRETPESQRKYTKWHMERGDRLLKQGHNPRTVYDNTGNKRDYSTKSVPTTTKTKVKEKNPNYGKKTTTTKSYSEKAKNPGGGPGSRFVGKKSTMTDKQARDYKNYLKRR